MRKDVILAEQTPSWDGGWTQVSWPLPLTDGEPEARVGWGSCLRLPSELEAELYTRLTVCYLG